VPGSPVLTADVLCAMLRRRRSCECVRAARAPNPDHRRDLQLNSTKPCAAIAIILCVLVMSAVRVGEARVLSDPCTMLTQDEIKAVVGADVPKGQPVSTTGCQWLPATPSKEIVTLALQNGAGWAELKAPVCSPV